MRDRAGEIVDVIDLDSKTDRFPEVYPGDYDGELDYIEAVIQWFTHPRLAPQDLLHQDLIQASIEESTVEGRSARSRNRRAVMVTADSG